MSRRKQACPIRSVKAVDEPPTVVEADNDGKDPESLAGTEGEEASNDARNTAIAEENEDIPELTPLVINTENPSSPPESSALDDTPPLTNSTDKAASSSEDPQPFPSTSPGLDIPPLTASVARDVVPLSLTLPSSPTSPDHPSTPSSLNSSNSALESNSNKQRRGKKIMPVAGNDGKRRWQCPICSEQLGSDHDFTAHIRSHNTTQAKQPNTCTICGKVLSSQSSLDRHMLVHSGERPFKCKVCKMSFTTNGNMHRHSRIHNKEELRAASLNASQESGRKSSKSRSSSKTPSVSAAAAKSPSSAISSFSSVSPNHWHRPAVFSPERPTEPAPMSGVDLQKFMTKSLQRPSPFPSMVSPPLNFVNPIHMNMLSQMMENRKRFMSSYLPETSPTKRPRADPEDPSDILMRLGYLGSPDADAEGKNNSASAKGDASLVAQSRRKSLRKSLQNPSSTDHQPAHDECKHCHKTFISDYGLEYHLSQHHKDTKKTTAASLLNGDADESENTAADEHTNSTSASFKCNKCEEAFATQPMLVVHNLVVHLTNQQAEEAVAEALAGGKNGFSKVMIEAAMPGFSDLDFMDFTTDKFSLAAKAWCEQMPRRSMSKYHDFTCEECSCSFPSRSSLVLHKASHKPQNWTKCRLCDCYFVSKDLLLVHMYKHAADQSFSDSLKQDRSENAGMPESMAKNDFLAMFEVVAKEELCSSTANEDVIETISKEQNDKYFDQLSKVFARKKSDSEADDAKTSLSPNDDSGNGSSSSGSGIPSTPTHDNKVPSPSKNIPVFPSMSTPPGVLSSLASQGTLSSSSIFPPFLAAKPNLFGQGEYSPARFSSPSVLGIDMDGNQDQKKGVYNCQFCGETFLNSRALKGHTRIHLGLSPYKCQFCSYSSADKSTLIRHMRTHNGQRPFMCTTCKYAFTTKANCERHIRKKHGVNDKEEIERSVTFKNCPADPTEGIECFQSPDTVCQYCGEDFKFFRSLKNHLKTHSSCRQKPFTCTKCLVGFSMKANVIRHIQKQHLEVPHKDIENYILVNEPTVPLDADDDSDNLGADYETGSPSPSSTPGASGQDSTPPLAHSTPVFSTNTKNAVPQADLPLDFSLKNSDLAARLTGMMNAITPQSAGSGVASAASSTEQPIDLTVKRKPLSSTTPSSVASLSPKPATPSTPGQAPSPAKLQQSSTTEIPCNLCNKVLANKEAAQQHLIEVHQIPPSVFTSLPLPSDNNNNTSGAGSQLASILPLPILNSLHFNSQLSSILKARAAVAGVAAGGGGVPVFPTHPAFSHVQQKLQAYLQSSTTAAAASSPPSKSVHPSLLATGSLGSSVKKEPGTTSSTMSTGSESSCDLASVKKIIESTTTQNIEIFLKPQVINSGSDDSEPHTAAWESGDEDSDQSLEQLYKQSLNGKISVKSEPSAVEEVASEDKDDENEDFDGEHSDEEDRESDAEMDKSDSKFAMEDSLETNSTKSSGSKAGADPKSDAGSVPVKKKRNSYADSPHKLNCPHCPRSFPWVSSLNRHMLTHTGQKPFKCPRCPVTFSTKSNRERHLIRKHGVNMLDPASRQTMDRPYKCHLCVFSSFSTESNLLKHYKERHPGCNPPERYLMKMEGEMEALELGQQMDKMDELAMAGLDNNSNLDDWSESASMDAEDEEGLAPATKTPVSAMVENVVVASLLKKELKTSPVPSAGKDTDNNNTTTRNGTATNNNGYDENDNEEDSNDVPLSAASFSGSAERHINPERDNYNVDKITFCWKCGEQFTSRKVLVRHLKEHNIDLPFKCYLCDASYESRHECLLHQEKSHVSDWTILQEKNGVDNIDEYAEKLDRIVERNCRTGQFGDDGEEGDSVATAAAGEDGQTEMVASDYLQRKVYCSLCSKRFWSLQDLRRHMRSHTGERPFECDKCQKRFTLKHSMMRHRRKHTTTGNTDSPAGFSDDEDDIQALDTSSSGTKAPAVNMGSGHKALRQHLAAAVMRAANIPTSVTESRRNTLMMLKNNKNEEEDEDDDQDDMLHNLLGVESSTIDQMIEAKASAASLLGV